MSDIKYSVTSKKNRNMCDFEDAVRHIRTIEILAHDGDKIVGTLDGYIFDMYGLMKDGLLQIFDESCVLERLYCTLYHGTPLILSEEDVIKGLRPEFLSFINEQFGDAFFEHEDFEFDDELWATHFNTKVGFVEDVRVNKDRRGEGIGKGLMSMLKKFTRSIDYLILQSYPNAVDELVKDMKLTRAQEEVFVKSKKYDQIFNAEQQKVNSFYQGIGLVPYKAHGYQWMVMDKEGIKKLPAISQSHIIKRRVKRDTEASLDF